MQIGLALIAAKSPKFKNAIFVGFLGRLQEATKKTYKNAFLNEDLQRKAGNCSS
ncbi:hypothetical protein [Polaribacter sp.]|uniref:hypothetical protein n=1 Tax=Polaribacter sp. TaxID=1920175 RepID=UPI00404870F3